MITFTVGFRKRDVLSIIGLALVCCSDNRGGYVRIRLMSMIDPQNAVYLGEAPLFGTGDRIIQEKVGRISLTNGRSWGSGKTYCDLQVRKDRITIVTVQVVNSQPRCE